MTTGSFAHDLQPNVFVSKLSHDRRETSSLVHAEITIHEVRQKVWFEIPRSSASFTHDAFAAIGLLPAMRIGGVMRLEGSLSVQLSTMLPTIQDVLLQWLPELRRVEIEPESHHKHTKAEGGVASFFSGGVDSFYSLIKHHDEITDLLVVHGFDVFLSDQAMWEDKILPKIKNAASAFGKNLIEIRTNLRSFSDAHEDWTFYHGPALASVALLLAQQFRKVYIPSSYSYSQLFPYGSHPLLDPMWSIEGMNVVHDGAEASRMDKIRKVASSDVALNSLRVCWENRDKRFNCGQCEKCLRTMAALEVIGALESCATFPALDLEALSALPLPDEHSRMFMEEVLHAAEKLGCKRQLIAPLRNCVRRRGIRARAHDALDKVCDTLPSPLLRIKRRLGNWSGIGSRG